MVSGASFRRQSVVRARQWKPRSWSVTAVRGTRAPVSQCAKSTQRQGVAELFVHRPNLKS